MKLPKNPKKGQLCKRKVNGRIITWKATGKKFPPWVIISNKKA